MPRVRLNNTLCTSWKLSKDLKVPFGSSAPSEIITDPCYDALSVSASSGNTEMMPHL